MLLNDTRTDRMQLTQQQREELTAHVRKWANIDGDYEATMLGGIWHYRCDSGIFEDALSVADREWITANTEADGEQYDFAQKHSLDDEDVARECKFIEENDI